MDSHTHNAAQRAADWLEANPDKHTTGTMARDAQGLAVMFESPNAVCFCAIGRFARELLEGQPQPQRYGAFSLAGRAIGNDLVEQIVNANDTGKRAHAIALLRTI